MHIEEERHEGPAQGAVVLVGGADQVVLTDEVGDDSDISL
jgi:hypothetical protein